MEFFCKNYGYLFHRKSHAWEFVNKEFGTNFSASEVEAICTVPRIAKAGLIYVWRYPDRRYYN